MKTDKEYLVKGSLINGLGLVTRVVSPFLIILLARFYPQKSVGLFLSFQALVMTLSRAAILGLDKGLLWYVPARDCEQANADTGLAGLLAISLLLCAAVFAVFLVLGGTGLIERIHTLRGMRLSFVLVMAASVAPFTVVQLFCGALEGKRRPQYRVFIGLFLTTSLVPLLALASKRFLGDDLSLAAGMLLGNLLGCLLFIPAVRAHFRGEAWGRSLSPPARLLHYSLPLAGADLIGSVLGRLDLWMILLLLGPEKAAVYAFMITISNGLRTVRQTFDPLLIPVVSNLRGEELGTKLRASFSYATNMVSTLQLFIACFILVFPREILSIAGKGYAIEIFAFALLLVGNLLNGFLGLNGTVVLGLGKSRLSLGIIASALALNLLCNWIFIPRLGMTGAALAYCVNLLYQNVVQYVYVRFVRKLDLYEPHLYLNAVLEIAFLAVFFSAYRKIAALSLVSRSELFGLLLLVLGGMVLLKRKSFILK